MVLYIQSKYLFFYDVSEAKSVLRLCERMLAFIFGHYRILKTCTNRDLSHYRDNAKQIAIIRALVIWLLTLFQPTSVFADRVLNTFCPMGSTVQSKDGIRRLALIVGVGQYKNDKIPDLAGPPNDAKRIYDLLTSAKGYSFPKENVCVLLDEAATTANFKKYFTEALVNRAQAKDEAVIFYAGHGSQAEDTNKDEPDGMDETFVFHDARSDGSTDLIDDEFEGLLQRLYAKTHQISVFLDSCNSGTALRSGEAFAARFIPPEKSTNVKRLFITDSSSNKGTGWVSGSMTGIVAFTAAGDGTPALEKNGEGVFTNAILTAFGQINANKPTYAQAARQIMPLVKAESYQIPYFQGDLQRSVFSDSNRIHPLSWEVIEIKPSIKIGGLPLPGIGKNAEFRVYDGAASGVDTQDPAKAKAVIVVDNHTGINATTHVISRHKHAKEIKPGDLVVLARPGDQQTQLKIALRPESQPEGIPPGKATKLRASLNSHPDAKKVITITPSNEDFELSLDSEGKYVVRGPENTIRNRISAENDVINNLWLHSKQKVFSALRGEGGDQFTDQETLQVQLVPAKNREACAKNIRWQQEPMNSMAAQKIPLCYKWNVKVKLSEKSPVRLLVGGLVLSTDGGIFGFPVDRTVAPLSPGDEIVFASKRETFKASPPLNIEDQIIVFGTYETNPVPWARMTETAETRAADNKSGLYRTLDNYLKGTRGVEKAEETETTMDTAWTLSSITMSVYDPKK